MVIMERQARIMKTASTDHVGALRFVACLLSLVVGCGCATSKSLDAARGHAVRGQHEGAIEFYVVLLQQDPLHEEGRAGLQSTVAQAYSSRLGNAQALEAQNRWAEAIAEYDRVICLGELVAPVGGERRDVTAARQNAAERAAEAFYGDGERFEATGKWMEGTRAFRRCTASSKSSACVFSSTCSRPSMVSTRISTLRSIQATSSWAIPRNRSPREMVSKAVGEVAMSVHHTLALATCGLLLLCGCGDADDDLTREKARELLLRQLALEEPVRGFVPNGKYWAGPRERELIQALAEDGLVTYQDVSPLKGVGWNAQLDVRLTARGAERAPADTLMRDDGVFGPSEGRLVALGAIELDQVTGLRLSEAFGRSAEIEFTWRYGSLTPFGLRWNVGVEHRATAHMPLPAPGDGAGPHKGRVHAVLYDDGWRIAGR